MPFNLTCQICQTPHVRSRRPKAGAERAICSPECLSELRRRTGRRLVELGKGPPKATAEVQRKAAIGRTGKGHGWMQGGYRFVRDAGRDIAEHRLVMERHLGRPLTPDEVVHHRNEDKLDNRLDNLELCKDRAEHFRKHHAHIVERRPECIEAVCAECATPFRTVVGVRQSAKCHKCRRYYLG